MNQKVRSSFQDVLPWTSCVVEWTIWNGCNLKDTQFYLGSCLTMWKVSKYKQQLCATCTVANIIRSPLLFVVTCNLMIVLVKFYIRECRQWWLTTMWKLWTSSNLLWIVHKQIEIFLRRFMGMEISLFAWKIINILAYSIGLPIW